MTLPVIGELNHDLSSVVPNAVIVCAPSSKRACQFCYRGIPSDRESNDFHPPARYPPRFQGGSKELALPELKTEKSMVMRESHVAKQL
jgi:hypothetical protein